MLKPALTFIALLAAPSAFAYSPETLLSRWVQPAPQALDGSQHQFLNPFNQVTIGLEHSWDQGAGTITADDKGRTRARDEKSKANQVTLQVKPKSFEQLSTYRAYERTLRESTSVENRLLRAKNAKAAYALLIRAARAKDEQKLLGDWNVLLERAQKMSSIEARTAGDAKAVLKAAAEIDKARNEMAEINGNIAGVSHTLAARGLKLEELESDQILAAEDILAGINKLGASEGSLTRDAAVASLDLERTGLRHANAQRDQWLDSVKFSVQKGSDSILRRRFDPIGETLVQNESRTGTSYSIGLSFRLPFLAAADLDEQRDRIKMARLELDRQEAAAEASEQAINLRTQLNEKAALIASMVTGKLTNADALLRTDPSLAIELQRTELSRRLMKIKLLAEVRSLYIDLLFETGQLSDAAELNQLSKGKKAGV